MIDIYRIFECHQGILSELAFVTVDNVSDYLESCNKYNTDSDTFYFASVIKIEKWIKELDDRTAELHRL